MGKVIVSEFVSLDGVMEAPDQWHFPFSHDAMGAYKFDELRAADAMLLGRVTYDEFAAAWPTMPDTGEFGERMNGLPKYVVSTTLNAAAWHNSHRINEKVPEAIAGLKREIGGDILIAGSADLINSLLPHDLIDEYRLMIHPVVVGRGKRLFRDGNATKALTLAETKQLGPNVVVLTYQRAAEAERR